MISFDEIEKPSRMYDALMFVLNIVHNHIYYKHCHVINPENIPVKGTPTFVIANHQNGLMDAMAVLHTLYKSGRQPVFIARGDIFKKDGIAKILRFMKILPVFRNRDGGRDDVKKDLEIFSRAAKVLDNKNTLVIFPEAGHQEGHFMSTFKKGFSRIAFSAEEMAGFNLDLQILPLNIHYSNYFNFRSDLMVTCGEPFTIKEFFEMYKEAPNQAFIALNEKARERVKLMTPDIDIPEYRDEIEALNHFAIAPYLVDKGLDVGYLPNRKDAFMDILDTLRKLKSDNEADFISLMTDTKEYVSLLKSTKLHHWTVNRKFSVVPAIVSALLLLLVSPLALFGFVNNFVPTALTHHFSRKTKDPMFISSFQYVIGCFVAFPLWYTILLVTVGVLCKSFLVGLGYIVISAAAGMLNMHYKKAVSRFFNILRMSRMKNSEAYRRLSYLNKSILGRMKGLLAVSTGGR